MSLLWSISFKDHRIAFKRAFFLFTIRTNPRELNKPNINIFQVGKLFDIWLKLGATEQQSINTKNIAG